MALVQCDVGRSVQAHAASPREWFEGVVKMSRGCISIPVFCSFFSITLFYTLIHLSQLGLPALPLHFYIHNPAASIRTDPALPEALSKIILRGPPT